MSFECYEFQKYIMEELKDLKNILKILNNL